MPLMFEFSPEKRIFLEQREKFAIVQRLPKRKKLETNSRHCVGISKSKSPKKRHKCNILASKRANNCARQLKRGDKFLNFTCITYWGLFSFDCCWFFSTKIQITRFSTKNPDYTSQNADHKILLFENKGVIFWKHLTQFCEHRIICWGEITYGIKVGN